MGTLKTASLGALVSWLTGDGTDFWVPLCDTAGILILLLGYTGSAYVPLKVDANGYLQCVCVGAV